MNPDKICILHIIEFHKRVVSLSSWIKKTIYITFLVLIISSGKSIAQNNDSTQVDTSKTQDIQLTMKMTKSPMGALYRSLAIPGWGQIYNERYWKAPLFFGGAATLVYLIIDNNNKYSNYSAQYEAAKSDPNANLEDLQLKREFYRDARDMSAFYLLAVYVVCAVDAYADAHLYDFNVGDDLSANMYVSTNGILYAGLTIKF